MVSLVLPKYLGMGRRARATGHPFWQFPTGPPSPKLKLPSTEDQVGGSQPSWAVILPCYAACMCVGPEVFSELSLAW